MEVILERQIYKWKDAYHAISTICSNVSFRNNHNKELDILAIRIYGLMGQVQALQNLKIRFVFSMNEGSEQQHNHCEHCIRLIDTAIAEAH